MYGYFSLDVLNVDKCGDVKSARLGIKNLFQGCKCSHPTKRAEVLPKLVSDLGPLLPGFSLSRLSAHDGDVRYPRYPIPDPRDQVVVTIGISISHCWKPRRPQEVRMIGSRIVAGVKIWRELQCHQISPAVVE